MYIGITSNTNPNKRFGNKGQGYKTQVLMNNAIQKYGWENIKHVIIARGLSESMAQDFERYLIRIYKTTDSEYGYNVCVGGQIIPEEARKYLSECRTGKKKSEEHKRKIGIANTGTKHSLDSIPNIRAVLRYNFKTLEYVGEYVSVSDAARRCGIAPIAISNCANGSKRKAGDSVWFYKDEATQEFIEKRLHDVKMPKTNCPIKVVKDNKFDEPMYFESCLKASEYSGVSQSHILRLAKNGNECRSYRFYKVDVNEFFEKTGLDSFEYFSREDDVRNHREYKRTYDKKIDCTPDTAIRCREHFSEIYVMHSGGVSV